MLLLLRDLELGGTSRSLPWSIISNVKCQKWACVVCSREELSSGLQQRKRRSTAQLGVRAFVAGDVHNEIIINICTYTLVQAICCRQVEEL